MRSEVKNRVSELLFFGSVQLSLCGSEKKWERQRMRRRSWTGRLLEGASDVRLLVSGADACLVASCADACLVASCADACHLTSCADARLVASGADTFHVAYSPDAGPHAFCADACLGAYLVVLQHGDSVAKAFDADADFALMTNNTVFFFSEKLRKSCLLNSCMSSERSSPFLTGTILYHRHKEFQINTG